jgi:hypothetical protein
MHGVIRITLENFVVIALLFLPGSRFSFYTHCYCPELKCLLQLWLPTSGGRLEYLLQLISFLKQKYHFEPSKSLVHGRLTQTWVHRLNLYARIN